MALALRLYGDAQDSLAGGVDLQVGTVGHAKAKDVHVVARSGADSLGEEREPDADQLSVLTTLEASPLFGLLTTKLVVTGDLHGELQRLRIVARVVFPSG